MKIKFVLLLTSAVFALEDTQISTLEEVITKHENDTRTFSLSRKKRFITFPEGSSFQLVLCSQRPALVPIGDIFLYGNTAALAWELPSDASYINLFKDKDGNFLRRQDTARNVYYTDDRGKVLFKVPFKKHAIVNPAFAKRSIDEFPRIAEAKTNSLSTKQIVTETKRREMHEVTTKREFLKIDRSEAESIKFHRNSRKQLFEKLEIFLKALGVKGRGCLLRVVCEAAASRSKESQGSFMQELMTSVFTLPEGEKFEKAQHQEYDEANAASGHCKDLYQDCNVSTGIFK